MSEQVGAHGAPLGGVLPGAENAEYPPDLEAPRSAAAPFELADQEEKPSRGWRAWAIVGAAVAIPAALAAALVLTLGGGSDAPPVESSAASSSASAVVEPAVAPTVVAAAPAAAAVERSAPEAAAPAVAESSIEVSAAADAAAAPAVAAAEPATPEERLSAWGEMVQVTIVGGDSVWALAFEYGTTVEAIALVNGLTDPTALSIGDVLMIPSGFTEPLSPAEAAAADEAAVSGSAAGAVGAGSTGTAAASQTAFAPPPAGTALTDWPNLVSWTIQPGDSLSVLATTFDTTAEAIMALNGISDPNLLYAGTELSIPVGYSDAVDVAVPAVSAPAVSTSTTASDELQDAAPAAPSTGSDELEDTGAPAASTTTSAGGDYLDD